MKHVFTGARIILGLIFLIFGLNGFFNFLPPQPPLPEPAMNFIMALVNSGYILKLVKGIEVLAGIALLTNRFVALALLFLAPIVINILLFHTILAPAGAVMAIGITFLTAVLAYANREKYSALFESKSI